MDEDTDFWAALAAEHLRALFAAAMLTGLDARAVAGWIRRDTFTEPEGILRDHGMDVHARQLSQLRGMRARGAAEAIKAAMLRPFACLGPQW